MTASPATERREYIKYRLRLQGSSLTALSRELGVSVATVSQVCGGMRTSERVLSAIAAKLGVAPGQLWPERGQAMRSRRRGVMS